MCSQCNLAFAFKITLKPSPMSTANFQIRHQGKAQFNAMFVPGISAAKEKNEDFIKIPYTI